MRKVFRLTTILLLCQIIGCVTVPRVDRSPAGRQLALPVSSLEGEPTYLTSAEGRVTVVLVFATWCDVCFDVLDWLEELESQVEDDLEVVAVSVDADLKKLEEAVQREKPKILILWDREGKAASRRLALERVPTILVTDLQGRIRRVFLGWDKQVERALIRNLDSGAS